MTCSSLSPLSTLGSRLPGVYARPGRHHHADEEAAGPAPHARAENGNRRMARRHVRIEHVNSRVKCCRSVHGTCRLRKAGIRDLLMEIYSALDKLRVRLTP